MIGLIAAATAMLLVAAWFIWPALMGPEVSALTPTAESPKPQRSLAIGLVLGVGILSAGLYAVVGKPDALTLASHSATVRVDTTPQGDDSPGGGPANVPGASPDAAPSAEGEAPAGTAPMAGQIGPAQIKAMVQRLAQRLQNQPNDPDGWRMLAKSYETLGRFEESAQAYAKLLTLREPDPDTLVDYAVVLGMSQDHTLVGEPERLIARALQLNPKHIQSLALAGSAAFERQDYAQAIKHWNQILQWVPADAQERQAIELNIDKARQLAEKDARRSKP
jgi:cytochrome c-type biogenesis protein CcmH/NrfG